MSNAYNQSPTFRSILLGIAAFLILIVLLCSLSEVVKFFGSTLLFFPAKLGVIQDVTPDDVVNVKLASSPSRLNLTRPGLYAVYADNPDLLELTDSLLNSHAAPWLKLKSLSTGQSIVVNYVERGLHVFDSALVRGRPIFTFNVTAPGTYEMTHPLRPATTVSVLPDNITGHEAIITLAALVQLAIVSSPLAYVGLRRYRQYQGQRAQIEQRTKEVDAKWRAAFQKMQDEQRNKESK